MNLSLTEWILVAAASWTILAFVVAVPIGRGMRKADERDREWFVTSGLWRESGPQPVTAPYPPPIAPSRPRITQADVDATWLAAWPVGSPEDAAEKVTTALRFEQIAEANRFHEFLPGTWA